MKTKNACIISKFIYENDTRLQQQVSILEGNDFHIDVICQLDEKKNINLRNNVNIYGVSTPAEKDTIIKYIFNTVKFSIPAFLKLQKLSLAKKYDIIIVHTLPEFLVFTTVIQKLLGAKIILDVRDTSVELFDSKWNNKKRRIFRKFVVLLANFSCCYADKIIVASPGFKEKLLERKVKEDKITIIFNSADTEIFKFDDQRKFEKIDAGLKIIYHGSIAERFGIDIAIKAIKYIIDVIPNTRLNIYGFYDTEYKLVLEKLISKLGLENNVILNGRESLESIYSKIKEADLGIVPYKDDFFMQLAFSTKLFEYVVSGIPVVTSRLKPAESIFSDESLFFVKPRNPKELADKIIFICYNPEIRKLQVQNAYKDYAKISSNVMNKHFFNIVNKIFA